VLFSRHRYNNQMKIKTRVMRTTAMVISLALIQASFGPEAWAQFRAGDVNIQTGNGGSSAAGSASAINSVNAVPTLQMPAASLTSPAAGVISAPTALASLPASAISGAAPAAPAALTRSAAPARAASASAAPAALYRSAAPAAAAAALLPAAASSPEKGNVTAQPGTPVERATDAPAEISGNSQSAPAAGRVSALVSRRIAEFKSLFSGRKDAGATPETSAAVAASGVGANDSARPSGLTPAAKGTESGKVSSSGGDTAPPAPPTPPSEGPKDGGKSSKGPAFGLGLAGASIIGYMLTMQVGLEAQGVAMPQLTENAFKDFTLLPLVTVFASIGSMVGQPMSKFFTEKFGLAKTFYGAQALRAISLGAMVLMFGTGMMSIPLMMAFYAVNGVVTGVSATAEGTLRKMILADKGISQQSFRTWWQLLAESLAVPAPMIFGALVHSLGAIGAPIVTAVYPVTILLGLILAYVLKVYPLKDVKKASDAAAAASAAAAQQAAPSPTPSTPEAKPAPKGNVWSRFKGAAGQIFKNMEDGKNYVLSVPYLKYSLAAAVVFDLFNIMIYRLIAPGYGKMTGGEAGLSAIQGNIVGMFSLGGLLLSIVFITMENVAKARAKKNPAPDAATVAAAERSSMLRWTLAGIPAIALLATMALHVALPLAPLIFAGTNWVPSSLLAAALIPFGFMQVAASIKLNSYFQEKLPNDPAKIQKALAFSGSMMTALSIVAMLAMRPLFSAVAVFNPFPYLAATLLPAAAIGIFYLYRKLATATKPEAIAAADEAQKSHDNAPAKPSGYVGLILGIVAAAVVITALPMIPGIAGFIAGLGVGGKFALNLALTLLLPVAGFFTNLRQSKAKAKPAAPTK
jgi:hypothetical protein